MVNWMRNRHVGVVFCTLLMVCMSCSSCETLKKKFTRQKKNKESADFNPVLEPMDYPAPEYNAVQTYSEHYSLIKVWYKDLLAAVTEKNDSDSRARYALKQVHVHLDAMKALLSPGRQPAVESVRGTLRGYEEALKSSSAVRNRGLLQSDLRLFERKLRHDLGINVIKKDLIKLEPPH